VVWAIVGKTMESNRRGKPGWERVQP